MRLIDADELLEHVWDADTRVGYVQVVDRQDIENAPTIEERKTGEWEEIEVIPEAYDIAGVRTWASKMRCNQCGFTTFAIEGKFAQYDYCPHCGADMRGGNER